MSHTIGRRIPSRRKGDRTCLCDTCDVRYYRSQLVKGSDGLLRCFGPGTNNDADGYLAAELDEMNAEATYFESNDEPTDGRFDSGADEQ